MKKFEELKKLAEKHLDYDYDVETLRQYCELEPQEIEYINMTNPATILALLADREQLREALQVVDGEAPGQIFQKAREALKRSDVLEKE